jgi:hypothetical protein
MPRLAQSKRQFRGYLQENGLRRGVIGEIKIRNTRRVETVMADAVARNAHTDERYTRIRGVQPIPEP